MHFTVTADTDIGIAKETNQDSVLFKHGTYSGGEVLMAVIWLSIYWNCYNKCFR